MMKMKKILIIMMLILTPVLFTPLTFATNEPAKLLALRVLTFFALFIFLLDVLRSGELRFKRSFFNFMIVSWIILLVIVSFSSINLHTALFGDLYRFEGFFTVLNYFFLFAFALNLEVSRELKKTILYTLIFVAVVTSVYGIFQYFGLDFFTWNIGMVDITRSFSTFGNAVFFGNFIALILPILFAFFLTERKNIRKTGLFLTLALLASALVFSFTRGAWIGALLGLIFVFSYFSKSIFKDKKNILYLLVALILLGLLLFMPMGGEKRTFSERVKDSFKIEEESVGSRVLLWKSSLLAIKDNPALGTGPDTFRLVFPKYRPKSWYQNVTEDAVPDKAHNEILQVGVTHGLYGLLFFVWFLVALFIYAYRNSDTDPGLIIGMLGGLFSYVVSLFSSFSIISVAPVFWILSGFIASAVGPEEYHVVEIPKLLNKGTVKSILVIIGALLLLGSVFLAAKVFYADTFMQDAWVFRNINRLEEAAMKIDRATELNPFESKYFLRLGEVYYSLYQETQQGDYREKAIKSLKKAEGLNGFDTRIYFYLGNIYSDHRRTKDLESLNMAANNFSKILSIDPNNRDAHFYLGLVYSDAGSHEDAVNEFTNTINLDPSFISAYFALGKTLESLAQFGMAKSIYTAGLEYSPDSQILTEALEQVEVLVKQEEERTEELKEKSQHF